MLIQESTFHNNVLYSGNGKMTHRSAPLPTCHSIILPSWRLAILFALMFVVINFTSDTRFVLVGKSQRGAGKEYNSRQSEGHPPTFNETVHSTIYRTKTVYTTQDIGQKGTGQHKIPDENA